MEGEIMNKIGFAVSFLLFILGWCGILLISILTETIPLMGKMASQFSPSNSYGELMYAPNYTIAIIIAILMIVIGGIMGVYFMKKEKNINR